MMPIFPNFKRLTIEDKDEIDNITSFYPPSSDYNFAGMWSYNTEEKIEISKFDNSLVVKFQDYITGEPFYSFFGTQNFVEIANMLLEYASRQNYIAELKLIPDFLVPDTSEINKNLIIEEDRDNNDYILSVSEISTLQGSKYRAKKNFVNRFLKTYPNHSIEVIDIQKQNIQQEIEELFYTWEKNTKKTREETNTELVALKRLMKSADKFLMQTLGIYVNQKLISFSMDEIVKKYGIIHFEKADTSFVGIYQYLKHMTAKHLQKLGCEFINYEQDLGIEGLRKAKESWNPISYLKKYKIKKR